MTEKAQADDVQSRKAVFVRCCLKKNAVAINYKNFKENLKMKARIPKNMGGGAQNMNQMIKQAQRMQDQITELQEDIEEREFSATAGGGAVEVTVTGKKTIKALSIKPEVVDPEDIDMLQDLIISAINEAVNNVEATTEEEMSKITGGVSLPGLF